jgi:hypothetical protein
MKVNNDGWTRASHQVFWGEIAPCEHVVQIYENDQAFLDLLAGFVSGGVSAGDAVIVIATTAHLKGLDERLTNLGYNVSELSAGNQFIPLDAEKILAKFMVNGWPDETLFNHVVGELLSKAKRNGRQVRAFGEMVALLWAKGQVGATVRLEQLWNLFCENEAFCLFCAYPKGGFTQDAAESVMHICGAHSKMIAGTSESMMTDLLFKDVKHQHAI